jgi:GNAT superfamily N-acetyltransferase
MITIRLAQNSDIPTILEIRRKTFSHFAPSAYTTKEVATLLGDIKPTELEEMIKNESLFVAEKENLVVGCGGWHGESVRHMYVSPEMTKGGIGSSLLRMLEDDYRRRTGNSVIRAGVILYARPFYEKNGYEFLGIDTDWDGSTYNKMQKKLL